MSFGITVFRESHIHWRLDVSDHSSGQYPRIIQQDTLPLPPEDTRSLKIETDNLAQSFVRSLLLVAEKAIFESKDRLTFDSAGFQGEI